MTLSNAQLTSVYYFIALATPLRTCKKEVIAATGSLNSHRRRLRCLLRHTLFQQ